jgi:pyruvate ferredoxin oxidoreductase alpha subunit
LIPDEKEALEFLPPFKPAQPVFRASQPMARASVVFGGGTYTYFRIQHDLAVRQAETIFNETAREFAERFGRTYAAIERFHMDDAEVVFVMSNSFTTKGKSAVLKLRKQGIKVGLLKLCLFRPFPSEAIAQALAGCQKVAVIDQNLAPGMGGIIFPEIVTAMYGRKDCPERILSVIGGLGGKDIKEDDFLSILERLNDSESKKPLYLFDEGDWSQFQQLQKIALI